MHILLIQTNVQKRLIGYPSYGTRTTPVRALTTPVSVGYDLPARSRPHDRNSPKIFVVRASRSAYGHAFPYDARTTPARLPLNFDRGPVVDWSYEPVSAYESVALAIHPRS